MRGESFATCSAVTSNPATSPARIAARKTRRNTGARGSVAGKGEGMTRIVRGVMGDRDGREAGAEQEEGAEQQRGERRRQGCCRLHGLRCRSHRELAHLRSPSLDPFSERLGRAGGSIKRCWRRVSQATAGGRGPPS